MKGIERVFSRLVRPLSWDGNPILVRELRSLLRGRLFVWFLTIATFVLSLLVFTTGALEANNAVLPSSVGRLIFHLFFIVALLVLGIVAPSQSATSLTSEKEQKTFEGIILTGLSPLKILLGKFAGSVAAMFLVLVAFLPVVGIAFLFGGISPYHILFGYLSLLLLLAPSSSFGVAISAHLNSSRVATIISSLTSVAFTSFLLIMLAEYGDAYSFARGGGMGGPFFFVDLLVRSSFNLTTVSVVVAVAVSCSVFPTWFYLASALAALRPKSRNRVKPLKVWALSLSSWCVVVVAAMLYSLHRSSSIDIEQTAQTAMMWWGLVLLFFALVFINEPVVVRSHPDQEPRSPIGKVLALFGSGAAPTLRFTALLMIISTASMGVVIVSLRNLFIPEFLQGRHFTSSIIVLSVGYAASGVALVAFGALMRALTNKGFVARLLTVASLALTVFIPIFLLALLGDMSESSRDIPLVIMISPVFPIVLSAHIDSHVHTVWSASDVIPLASVSVVLAAILWTAVEIKTRKSRRAAIAALAARDERARESVPSLPLLQVARSSLIPGIPTDSGEEETDS